MSIALFTMMVNGTPRVCSFASAEADMVRFDFTHDMNCKEQLQAVSDKEGHSSIFSNQRKAQY